MSLFIETLFEFPLFFISVLVTVVVSIILHELAHGLVAVRLGDRTPIESGHMTFDPLTHMGPWSLMALAVIGIAWGQMPINPSRLKGKYAETMVAVAGPMTNLALAFVALTALGLWYQAANPADPSSSAGAAADVFALEQVAEQPPTLAHWVLPAEDDGPDGAGPFRQNFRFFLYIFGATNLVLCLFNLLPAPPLDGSHILANLHGGYRRMISNPNNGTLLMALFFAVFFIASALFPLCYDWSMAWMGLVAGVH